MQIHLSPRHMTLTTAIYQFVAEKISHLESQTDTIMAAHVVLVHDEAEKKRFTVKVHLAVPGPDIHAEAIDSDLYAAIDKVVSKLSRMIRKRKTGTVIRKKRLSQIASERRKREA